MVYKTLHEISVKKRFKKGFVVLDLKEDYMAEEDFDQQEGLEENNEEQEDEEVVEEDLDDSEDEEED